VFANIIPRYNDLDIMYFVESIMIFYGTDVSGQHRGMSCLLLFHHETLSSQQTTVAGVTTNRQDCAVSHVTSVPAPSPRCPVVLRKVALRQYRKRARLIYQVALKLFAVNNQNFAKYLLELQVEQLQVAPFFGTESLRNHQTLVSANLLRLLCKEYQE